MTNEQWKHLRDALDALTADGTYTYTITAHVTKAGSTDEVTVKLKEVERGIDWVG